MLFSDFGARAGSGADDSEWTKGSAFLSVSRVAGTTASPAGLLGAPGEEAEEAAIQDALDSESSDLKQARARFEARFLEAKLKDCGGNVSRLAEAVGMDRSALHRKLKSLNIQAD